jgi:hypothetical protein
MISTNNAIAAVAVVTIAIVASGCAASQMPSPHFAGDLALEIPVAADVDTVDVVITGTDMSRPAFARLEVEDGVARGVIQAVEAGDNRLVMVSAEMTDGRRCAGELSTNVAHNDTTAVEGSAMQCQALHTVPARTIAQRDRNSSDFPPVL